MLSAIKRITYILSLLSLLATACHTSDQSTGDVQSLIEEIKEEHAPDKRVALFDIKTTVERDSIVLSGETNLPEALQELKAKLKVIDTPVKNNVTLLPAKGLDTNTFGIVNISVANIRSKPGHSSELATQAMLGTPLNVLKKERGWYLVQTPDKYISWVDSGGILLSDTREQNNWVKADKIIFLKEYGFAFSEPNVEAQSVSDLVLGNILKYEEEMESFYKVSFPDGREAYVEKDNAMSFDKWLANTTATESSLVETSKRFMGVPYLWGGTSFKGVDCSGFTKSVYFLNGYVLPRDASQQVHSGSVIDTSNGFDNLQPGDLLFFGRKASADKKERIIHVGMWIGDGEFIHSSGRVRINSFDKNASNFNEYELSRFIRAKRILNNPEENKLKLSANLKPAL